MAEAARLLDCRPQEVFVASTGVIGEPLPTERLTGALAGLSADLDAGAWPAAAEAIMTTDTFPKLPTRKTEIAGFPVTLNGICKGSGMIAPDMATMLGFVFTDAAIPAPVLQRLLDEATELSFNSITVDGDTSTSDTVLLCATGKAGNPPPTEPDDPAMKDFAAALNDLMIELAHMIVRDGEGAQKFVTIRVSGAESRAAARRIGLAIGNSPLVKTAIAGADANWGRIVMAVGKAGERADRDRLAIRIGGCQVTRDGLAVPNYAEAPVARHMQVQTVAAPSAIPTSTSTSISWPCMWRATGASS